MLLQFMISFLLEWSMENEIPNSFSFPQANLVRVMRKLCYDRKTLQQSQEEQAWTIQKHLRKSRTSESI